MGRQSRKKREQRERKAEPPRRVTAEDLMADARERMLEGQRRLAALLEELDLELVPVVGHDLRPRPLRPEPLVPKEAQSERADGKRA